MKENWSLGRGNGKSKEKIKEEESDWIVMVEGELWREGMREKEAEGGEGERRKVGI